MLPGLDHAHLLKLAAHLVGRDDAEDLVQTVYAKALASPAAFEGRSAKQTWAIAILRRAAIDVWRERAKTPTHGAEVLTERAGTTPDWDATLDAEAWVEALPADAQAVFTLLGMRQADMAVALGWSRGRVRRAWATLVAATETLRR